jgi:antitoxin component of MazEF toxin-antitoxin module
MDTLTKIARYGNSLTVRVPAKVVQNLDLRDGDIVSLRENADGFVVERPRRSRLAARLATVLGPEPEIGTGHAVGAEVLD